MYPQPAAARLIPSPTTSAPSRPRVVNAANLSAATPGSVKPNCATSGNVTINDEKATTPPASGLTLYALATLYPNEKTNTNANIAIDPNQTFPLILIIGPIALTNPSIPACPGRSRKNTFNNTAIDPTIVIGIIPMNASLIATKCFCDPILAATGRKFFSIHKVILSISISPL